MHTALVTAVVIVFAAGCQSHDHKPEHQNTSDHGSAGSAGPAASGSAVATVPPADIDSKDILGRTETSPDVYVRHVLLAWEIRQRPWVVGDRVEARPLLRICATFDHRIIDGAAGRFAGHLTGLFSAPERLA